MAATPQHRSAVPLVPSSVVAEVKELDSDSVLTEF